MISPEDWHPSDGLVLEPNALRAAMEGERCLALTAGPGAGKTEMLAQRADFLLRTGHCPYPRRILAICFKVDAGRNLKERVRRRCGQDLASRFDSHTFHGFAKRIIDRFRVLLTGHDALDPDYQVGNEKVSRKKVKFDELLPLAIEILRKSAAARRAIRQTYSDVFLDEFQDCTAHQYEFVKLAFQGTSVRLTAVGDTKQKIMGWAGALDGIFTTFAEDFKAAPLNMYRNFRSQPRLLRMQNEIIRVMDPDAVMPDAQMAGDGGEILLTEFLDAEEEGKGIADAVHHWINKENVPPSEIAILISKQPELYAIQLMAALTARGVTYRNEQLLQDLSAEPVARLIADYLACIYGDREPAAWVRLMDQLIPLTDEDAQTNVRRDLQSFIAKRRKLAADVAELLDDPSHGWWENIKPLFEKVGVATLMALAPDYESRPRLVEVVNDTKARLEELITAEGDILKALARFAGVDAVRILSIHKSKGLEFDSVIIQGVEEQTFWSDEESERSAYFVAISRAKRRLMLTVSDFRKKPQGANAHWKEKRQPHSEFLGYATPFIK